MIIRGIALINCNAPTWGYGSALNFTGINNAEVTDCIFSNNYSKSNGGALEIDGSTVHFKRCVFLNNVSAGAGSAIFASTSITLTNVLFYGNSGSAAVSAAVYFSGGGNNIDVMNGTFVGNPNGAIITSSYGSKNVRNSIFWNNNDTPASYVNLYYCDIQNENSLGANGCFNTDPLFVDAVYYHLKSIYGQYQGGFFSGGAFAAGTTNSPCIDAGDPSLLPLGEAVPTGPRVNLGAYGNTSASAKSAPLSVALKDATDMSATAATLQGELLNLGGPNVSVWFYWGTTSGIWTTNAIALQSVNATQTFSLAIMGLQSQVAYYFTCFASNATGETAWAPTTNSFNAHLTAPVVTNRGVENERGPTVTLKGEVTDDGGDMPDVYVCWGLQQGSGTTDSWEHVVALGKHTGPFSTDITTEAGADYFYTCYATNGAGASWASPAIPFGASPLRYINSSAVGTGDGRSWANAYTNLLTALAACDDSGFTNTLCVAGGTYALTQTAWMTNSHVVLRGGYAGSGAPGNRDPKLYATVIRNGTGGNLRLCRVSAVSDVLIDGITFSGGSLATDNFAGLLIENASHVTVQGCTVCNSTASTLGGGIGVVGSSDVLLDTCMISNNTDTAFGGGVYLTNSAAVFKSCTIQNNVNSGEGAPICGTLISEV